MTDTHPHQGPSRRESSRNEPVRVSIAINLPEGSGRRMAQLQVVSAAAAKDSCGTTVNVCSRIAQGQSVLRARRDQWMRE